MSIYALLCRIRGRHMYDSAANFKHEFALMPKLPRGLEKKRIGTWLTCRCGAQKFFGVK